MQNDEPNQSPYQESEEVEEFAQLIMQKFPLIPAVTESARIKFLTKTQDKSKWAGQCHLTRGPWQYLSNFDYVILVWLEWWNAHDSHQKEALLFHELLHIVQNDKGKWKLLKHLIQEFPEVVMAYGAWSPELKCLEPIMRKGYR